MEPPVEKTPAPSKTVPFLAMSLKRIAAFMVAIATVVFLLYLFKIYIRFVLIWLENQDPLVVAITLLILFVLVSFPVGIGYIVLVVAEGYLFGMWRGLALAAMGANIGLGVAHIVLKLLRRHRMVYRYMENDMARAIMRVISGSLCFKIVFCSRLTPIPFGLQNTIFALSDVNNRIYHLASFLGLLPAQFVGVYVGTTLRSMQDVLEERPASTGTYLFFGGQLIIVIILLIWFSAKARKELIKALNEAETSSNNPKTNNPSSGFSIV